MPVLPPNVKHYVFAGIMLAGFAVKLLIPLQPEWHWLIAAAQILAFLGSVFTDAPGTAERLKTARSAGVIAGAMQVDRALDPDKLRGKGDQ